MCLIGRMGLLNAVISLSGLNYKKIHDIIQPTDFSFFMEHSPGAGRTGMYPGGEEETHGAITGKPGIFARRFFYNMEHGD